LLERFRWNVDSSLDQDGSARTTAIRDLVINEWKAFKQENYQQLKVDDAQVKFFSRFLGYMVYDFKIFFCTMQLLLC